MGIIIYLSGERIPFEKLAVLFGGTDDAGVVRGSEMVGDRYQDLLQEIAAITEYQWRSGTTRGLVKGSCSAVLPAQARQPWPNDWPMNSVAGLRPRMSRQSR